jgi:RNA polymerase sigma factor (sigma-70 family)
MSAVMAGDGDALEALVARHQGPLLGFFHRLLDGDRAAAEDLVQETFLRLLQQRSYLAGRPFKPWLYAIAVNLATDRRRARARRPSDSQPALDLLPDPRPGPEWLPCCRPRCRGCCRLATSGPPDQPATPWSRRSCATCGLGGVGSSGDRVTPSSEAPASIRARTVSTQFALRGGGG